jgi:hypothetical protein
MLRAGFILVFATAIGSAQLKQGVWNSGLSYGRRGTIVKPAAALELFHSSSPHRAASLFFYPILKSGFSIKPNTLPKGSITVATLIFPPTF